MAWLLWERAPLSRYLRRRQRGFHETDLQVAGGVLAEPGKEARAGVGDALGGAQNPFTFGPFADGEEDLAHRTLDARPVHLMLAGNLLRQKPFNPPANPANCPDQGWRMWPPAPRCSPCGRRALCRSLPPPRLCCPR